MQLEDFVTFESEDSIDGVNRIKCYDRTYLRKYMKRKIRRKAGNKCFFYGKDGRIEIDNVGISFGDKDINVAMTPSVSIIGFSDPYDCIPQESLNRTGLITSFMCRKKI